MGSKFFDIPFLTASSAGDFSCKDGEIEGKFGNNNTEYHDWASQVPTPDVDFALVRDILKGWHAIYDSFPIKKVAASEPTMEYWNGMAAQVLSQFESEATEQDLFVSPFQVMAAWKSIGGSYISPGGYTLLIPNSEVPLVATDSPLATDEMEMKVAAAVCSLRLRMRALELLRDFVGRISSLAIFVSEPLVSYDSYHAFIPSQKVTTENWCESLDTADGKIKRQRVFTLTLPLAWKANLDRNRENDDVKGGNRIDTRFYLYGEIPLSEVDRADEWCSLRNLDGIIYGKTGRGHKYEEIIMDTFSGEIKPSPLIIEGAGEAVSFCTRPLKLSGAGELKCIRRVSLRGSYTPGNLRIRVYGSRDMLRWWRISEKEGGTMAMLPRSPFRFYKVSVEGILLTGERLEGITLS